MGKYSFDTHLASAILQPTWYVSKDVCYNKNMF